MTREEQSLYERNIKYHGIEQETTIAMEECSELIQAISKCKRYGGFIDNHRDNLIEEIADVLIIINELQLIYDISDNDIIDIGSQAYPHSEQRKKTNRCRFHNNQNNGLQPDFFSIIGQAIRNQAAYSSCCSIPYCPSEKNSKG